MLTLQLQFDRLPVPGADGACCHLIARITPPPVAAPALPPLDLGLVIDASGSMNGAPLAAARQAVASLTDELPATTRLTVVSFAEDVVVHADAVPLDSAGRGAVRAAVERLRTRGSTDLHAGWMASAALLAAEGDLAGRRRQLVVLSDGRANRGEVDPQVLAGLAAAQLARGIVTSCVGVGDHYSPHQLSALAEHGGGSCHDAMQAAEIVEILRGEVSSLAAIVAEDVQLELQLPEDCSARELAGMPQTFAPPRLVVQLGAARAGVERVAVVRLTGSCLLAGGPANALQGTLSWRWPGARARTSGPTVMIALDPATVAAEPILPDAREVLAAWQAGLVRQVTDWNRDGDYERIAALWREQRPAFVAYAMLHAETAAFAATIAAVQEAADRPMHERTRKSTRDMAYKIARKEDLGYQRRRGSLAEQFGEPDLPAW